MKCSLSGCAVHGYFPSTLGTLVSLSCCLHGCSGEILGCSDVSSCLILLVYPAVRSDSPVSLHSASLQHVQDINFLWLVLLEVHCASSVGFNVFPSSEKLSATSEVVSYILPSLYRTPTKCILDDFSFCCLYLWPVFHSFFYLHIFHFRFLSPFKFWIFSSGGSSVL